MSSERDDEVTQRIHEVLHDCGLEVYIITYIDSEGHIRSGGCGNIAAQRGLVEHARDMVRAHMMDGTFEIADDVLGEDEEED